MFFIFQESDPEGSRPSRRLQLAAPEVCGSAGPGRGAGRPGGDEHLPRSVHLCGVGAGLTVGCTIKEKVGDTFFSFFV